MVADIDPLILELSAFIRAIRGKVLSVLSAVSCKIQYRNRPSPEFSADFADSR